MADRIKLRRGPKNRIDLNVYELGYATDSDEERLYFNNGSMVPIPNNKDITDIKTELTETTNVSNKNKQDVSELKESIAGIIKTGVAKLVQYSYDIELSENTKKVNIPYERYSSVTDTLKVYVNGLAIQNDQYTITDPVENDGIVTNGYIVLKVERPAGTIVRLEVWKNVPSGEEGEVSGNIITKNSLPLDRIIGIDDITSNISQLSNPNLLINGDFQVWQRGNNFKTNSRSIYTADRWMIDDGIVNNCDFGIKIQRSDNSKEVNFQQIVEDIKKLKGKTLTLSWESKINKNMTISCLIYSFTSDNNPIEFADINETYDSSLNIQKHSLTFEIPEDLNPTCSDLRIRIIRRTSEAELSVELRNVKLEIGDHPTEFVPRLYGEELALCQRYYCRAKISQNLIASDDKQIMTNINIPKTMRINPTATYDTDIYFHNLSDGNPILIGHKGDHPHSIDEYVDDCNLKVWICNTNSWTQITPGMCGVINSADTNDNRLSASAFIIFDAEIY